MSTTDEPVRVTPATGFATPPSGLTEAQVAQRVAAGRVNRADADTGRTVGQILRANIVTPFNGLLATLFVIILATGRIQNALFGFVIVANSAIGVFQEVRAKRTLDRLAVLNAPRARVVRDDSVSEIAVEDVVADELLELRTGDQVCADGIITTSGGLEIDESLLTGEADPIDKAPGDDVRSGSIVVAGTGRFRATAIGAEAYATALAAEAKRFTLTHSELVAGTNKLLRWISLMMLVVGPLLLWSQFNSADNHTWRDAVTGAVAALVGMVPEGLVLLTSLAFMIAAVTLSRKQTLVQELPAVEGLARVDVVCLDKTGTLTYGDVVFDEVQLLDPDLADDVDAALALAANAPDPNATAQALQARYPSASWTASGAVPFSSARKWSALSAAGHGTWVLGAPEMVLPAPADETEQAARDRADTVASQGRRTLLLATAPGEFDGPQKDATLPGQLRPVALVIFAERVREDAPETMRYFLEQGVALKVISGDNPRTVGAVAARVGVPGVTGADDAVDARTLPEDIDELAEILETKSAFGRVTPHQKRAVVAALQSRGHVVAMTGDGVNDAMALKDADIGVAMGNGSAATRSVAQLVLLDGKFSHLPDVVAEGRRVIANIERAASLFLVKNVYSLVLALITIATLGTYLFEPIQLSLISNLTIGVPAFFLALGPNRRRYIPGFLGRVLRFSVPCGAVVGIAAYVGYAGIRHVLGDNSVAAGRTVATIVTLICALWILVVTARPLAGWKVLLVGVMVGIIAVIVSVPAFATGVFLLQPTPKRVLVAVVVGLAGAAVVELTARGVAFASRNRGGVDGSRV